MLRRKQLHPIRKLMIQQGKQAVISVDKLYIDGQLYRDKDKSPLFFCQLVQLQVFKNLLKKSKII